MKMSIGFKPKWTREKGFFSSWKFYLLPSASPEGQFNQQQDNSEVS
jgi:hypothetical protein